MTDKPSNHRERLKGILQQKGPTAPPPKKEAEAEEVEAAGGAFGFLRGIRDRGDAVEFRFRDGNSAWFPYALLGPWQFNPSEGLLLKFCSDQFYLVLIRGSNLDLPLTEGAINLTSGLQRHRIVFLREMTDAASKQVGERGPTIDSITIAACESVTAVKDWLAENAPGFLG